MTPEAKVKVWAKNWIANKFPPTWRYMPRGGAFGNSGTPDILMCVSGFFVAIECKAEGNTPTALQQLRINEIRQAGGIAEVLTGKDEQLMIMILNRVKEKIDALH